MPPSKSIGPVPRRSALFAGRRGLIVAALVLLLLAVAGGLLWRRSGASGSAQGNETLIIGDQKGGLQALMQAAGELDHVPYKIQFALFPAASPLIEALDAGAIDIGAMSGAPFAFAVASGARIKAITASEPRSADGRRGLAIIVPKASALRSVADLKGRKLATIKGSIGHDIALQILERGGLKPGDVQWVYIANGEAKAALDSGSIDAWSTWGAYVGIATKEGDDRILADATGLDPGAGFIAANDAAITKKRAQLEDFIARLTRARVWVQTHRDDYARVLAKETGIPLEVARVAVLSIGGVAVPMDARLVASQRALFARYKAAGIITAIPDLDGAFDASFNGAALSPGRKAG